MNFQSKSKKVLILGASGMLGHKIIDTFQKYSFLELYGTVTNFESFNNTLPGSLKNRIIDKVYADKIKTVENVIHKIKPYAIINCIGVIKQNKQSGDTYNCIKLNALFPHQVAQIALEKKIRFITIATDCVFDGQKGEAYLESDYPTCHDVYGMTKYLGEVKYPNSLTLRTSIIGHELHSSRSLLDWFLSQTALQVNGYKYAIFSGFTTFEFAKLLVEKILPDEKLSGLYQISVNPISKFDLIKLVSKIYGKKIKIVPFTEFKINRSLNSEILRKKINYIPPSWENLIADMYQDFLNSEFYKNKREIYERTNTF